MQMTDSRGKKTHTLGFVTTAFTFVCFAFIAIVIGAVLDGQFREATYALVAFGTAVLTVLAPYLGREWMEKIPSVPKIGS